MSDEQRVAELAQRWGWPVENARTALEFMTEVGINPDDIPVLFNPED